MAVCSACSLSKTVEIGISNLAGLSKAPNDVIDNFLIIKRTTNNVIYNLPSFSRPQGCTLQCW